MWDGTLLPHSGQVLSTGLRQRLAPRRMRCFIFDVLRFGTAMAKKGRLWFGFGGLELVERGPSAIPVRVGRVLYITRHGLVHR